MITIKIMLLFFVLHTHVLQAHNEPKNSTQSFLYANELYKKGDFSEALKQYNHITYKSPHVFYNMGNCAYQLNKFGLALLYWRKAEINWGLFGRDEVLHNIELVKAKLFADKNTVKKESLPLRVGSYIFSHFTSFIKGLPLLLFQIAVLLMWLILLLYIRSLHRKNLRLLLMSLIFMQLTTTSMLLVKYYVIHKRYGVVITKQALLRAGPGETYKNLGELSQGDEVVIQKTSDNFYKITTNGITAWVSEKEVGSV